ncbi:MAG: hypothetical protein ACI9UK_002245 [Candidatus Krumholzibacteriia bacterium]
MKSDEASYKVADLDPESLPSGLDSDADGAFDPLLKTPFIEGLNDPELAADEPLAIFRASNAPNGRAIIVATFCLVSATMAQSQSGNLVLEASAEVESVQENTDGTHQVLRSPAVTVVPSDEVIYTLRYDNQSSDSADDIFITNPIPEHMEFRHADANPTWLETIYSIDGGLSYNHTPAPDALGFDPSMTRICVEPNGVFRGRNAFEANSFTIKYQAMVR